jgi:hypothetical protein
MSKSYGAAVGHTIAPADRKKAVLIARSSATIRPQLNPPPRSADKHGAAAIGLTLRPRD